MPTIDDFKRIAEVEFADIVKSTSRIDYKLRITLINNSFIDVHLSQKLPDKFGFHWECMDESRTFYRYDNFPDKKWQSVSTFPYHLHAGSQDAVEASPFPLTPVEGFRAFMEFVRSKLK
ncbi:MAG: DUF6516 family protein [Nitrospirota bacterium]